MGNEQEKQLINRLEKMPNIVDDRDKNALYNQIFLRLSEEETPNRKRKTKIIIPLLATAGVLFFLVSLPFLLNSELDQTTSFNESSEDRADIMINEESSSIVSDSEEILEEGGDETELMTEAEDSQNSSQEARVAEVMDSQSQIMHLAVYDDQLQYVIPISFILPKNEDLEDYYNNLANILASENILPDDYLLEGLKFELDFVKNEVLIKIPEDFTLGDGTAGTFQQLLEEMFRPYGFERAVFASNENEKKRLQLGPFGTLTELDIPKSRYASYLIYMEQYFVAIYQETNTSINTAIEALKTDIPDFNITHTVSENVSFQIVDSQSDLILTYTGDGNAEGLFTTNSIESILLTAKSYGYERVLFQNMPVNSVGIYRFSESIDVPIGVNPIDHTN